MAQRFAGEAEQAGSRLEVLTDERTPLRGRWDPTRLEQVVTNLLSNAIKYGAGKPIEIRVGGNASQVTLAIRDQGIGLSAEDAGRIFRRFERAVSSRFYGGLGLGCTSPARSSRPTAGRSPWQRAGRGIDVHRHAAPGGQSRPGDAAAGDSEISSPVTSSGTSGREVRPWRRAPGRSFYMDRGPRASNIAA